MLTSQEAIDAEETTAGEAISGNTGLAEMAVSTSALTEQDALDLAQTESEQYTGATQEALADAQTVADNAVTGQQQPIQQTPIVLASTTADDSSTSSVNKVIVITSIIGTIAALIYLLKKPAKAA